MKNLTFITGNQHKADYLARFLGEKIAHHKLDLDELQSLDAEKVIQHKVRQAYDILKKPVLVEDVTLTIPALGRLPGTLVKWFVEEIGAEGMCRMLDGFSDRTAISVVRYALHDGRRVHIFEGETKGSIGQHPKGEIGFGYDPAFIVEGWNKTRGEMSQEEYDSTSARFRALHKLKDFLENQ